MPKFAFLHCAYQELRQHFGTRAAVFSEAVDHKKYKATVGNIAAVFNVSLQAQRFALISLTL
jgi:hypothetical protein